MAGLFAANGSLNVTVVDGSAFTGTTAPDGSLNVVVAPTPVTDPVGSYHPCGALYVTTSDGTVFLPLRAPDGSLYVTEENVYNSGQRVTVVSGSFNPEPGPGSEGSSMGLLLVLTYAA